MFKLLLQTTAISLSLVLGFINFSFSNLWIEYDGLHHLYNKEVPIYVMNWKDFSLFVVGIEVFILIIYKFFRKILKS